MELLKKLKEYNKKDIMPMHMPGHKRKPITGLPTDIDITEIEGFDSLLNSSGILFDMQKKAAKVFGAERVFFLTNGSSGGVLASIVGLTQYGGEVIIARNSHKSVYNAIELNGLKAHYIAQMVDSDGIAGSITVAQVEEAVARAPLAEVVIITSPTYEGVVSDIKGIAEVVHKNGKKLIVDSAHGAHFGFWGMPDHAIKCGADAVVCSLHKTLPAMTSTALLLTTHEVGKILQKYVTMFQTTSPSYVLLASIDTCITLLKDKGDGLFKEYISNIKKFSAGISELKHLKVLCMGDDLKEKHQNFFDFDLGKIVIMTSESGITGTELMKKLREQKIELEMCYDNYALAMTSIFDSKEDFERLLNALILIDRTLYGSEKGVINQESDAYFKKEISARDKNVNCVYIPEFVYKSSDLKPLNAVRAEVEQSLGKVCAEYIWVYPPGIPLVVPGERIDEKVLETLKSLDKNGLKISSTEGQMPKFVFVVNQ